jgi:predicted tellurium resistance membrane protein TerC
MSKPSSAQLAGETLVIGVIFTLLFIAVHMAAMSMNAEFSMSHNGMFAAAFLAAAVFHLGAEYTGWNKRFCDEYR